MNFFISTLNDNGSGMQYNSKEEFLNELSKMIDDCIANGGSTFDVSVDADASCFYQPDESNDSECWYVLYAEEDVFVPTTYDNLEDAIKSATSDHIIKMIKVHSENREPRIVWKNGHLVDADSFDHQQIKEEK